MGQMAVILVSKNAPAKLLGTVVKGRKLHMRVLNAAVTLNFGSQREVLEAPLGPGGIAAGYTISSTDGLVEMDWEGIVYGLGAAANGADVQLAFGID